MKLLLLFALMIWSTEQADVGWCSSSPAAHEGCGEVSPKCLATDICAMRNEGPDCGYECMKSQTETIKVCGRRKCVDFNSEDCDAAKDNLGLSKSSSQSRLKQCPALHEDFDFCEYSDGTYLRRCKEILCQKLKIENADTLYKNSWSSSSDKAHQSRGHYSQLVTECKPGFELNDNNMKSLSCDSGAWSTREITQPYSFTGAISKNPECNPISCGTLSLNNGDVDYTDPASADLSKMEHRSIAKPTCDSSFDKIEFQQELICIADRKEKNDQTWYRRTQIAKTKPFGIQKIEDCSETQREALFFLDGSFETCSDACLENAGCSEFFRNAATGRCTFYTERNLSYDLNVVNHENVGTEINSCGVKVEIPEKGKDYYFCGTDECKSLLEKNCEEAEKLVSKGAAESLQGCPAGFGTTGFCNDDSSQRIAICEKNPEYFDLETDGYNFYFHFDIFIKGNIPSSQRPEEDTNEAPILLSNEALQLSMFLDNQGWVGIKFEAYTSKHGNCGESIVAWIDPNYLDKWHTIYVEKTKFFENGNARNQISLKIDGNEEKKVIQPSVCGENDFRMKEPGLLTICGTGSQTEHSKCKETNKDFFLTRNFEQLFETVNVNWEDKQVLFEYDSSSHGYNSADGKRIYCCQSKWYIDFGSAAASGSGSMCAGQLFMESDYKGNVDILSNEEWGCDLSSLICASSTWKSTDGSVQTVIATYETHRVGSSAFAACVPKFCPKFDAPRGQVAYTNPAAELYSMRQQGSELKITCDAGYGLSHNTPVLCIDGAWDNTPAVCQPKNCGSLDISDGFVTYSENKPEFGQMEEGSVVTWKCEEGRELIGTQRALCEDGQWIPKEVEMTEEPQLTQPQMTQEPRATSGPGRRLLNGSGSDSGSIAQKPLEVPVCRLFPTFAPTIAPTPSPTLSPTTLPTPSPTTSPTDMPSSSPTIMPTPSPTSVPTPSPSSSPTPSPTTGPTLSPSTQPSPSPTTCPSRSPTTLSPTSSPTKIPTPSPTTSPTDMPSSSPTKTPTSSPTSVPTPSPTPSPTKTPTSSPTKIPTPSPTKTPTSSPSPAPTASTPIEFSMTLSGVSLSEAENAAADLKNAIATSINAQSDAEAAVAPSQIDLVFTESRRILDSSGSSSGAASSGSSSGATSSGSSSGATSSGSSGQASGSVRVDVVIRASSPAIADSVEDMVTTTEFNAKFVEELKKTNTLSNVTAAEVSLATTLAPDEDEKAVVEESDNWWIWLVIIIVVLGLLALAYFSAKYGVIDLTPDKVEFMESDSEKVVDAIEIPSKKIDIGGETIKSPSVKVEEKLEETESSPPTVSA